MYLVLSTIVQKGGDCWCNILPPCVLEIVDKNSHGLIGLLMHTEKIVHADFEKNDVFEGVFEEQL
jgi:hypothetical protein